MQRKAHHLRHDISGTKPMCRTAAGTAHPDYCLQFCVKFTLTGSEIVLLDNRSCIRNEMRIPSAVILLRLDQHSIAGFGIDEQQTVCHALRHVHQILMLCNLRAASRRWQSPPNAPVVQRSAHSPDNYSIIGFQNTGCRLHEVQRQHLTSGRCPQKS